VSPASVKFTDGRLSNIWRNLKVGEQEVPQGVLALDEMPIRPARDEHQMVVVSSASEDDL